MMGAGKPGGESVVITGAAGGIGRALAHRFGHAGARVALFDRDEEGLSALAEELAALGVEALPQPCDVTSLASCRAAFAATCERWGGIDTLIANAGITHLGPFVETDVDVIRRVLEVNFFGAVNCTKAALDSLIERRGRIVVLSSVAGFAPLATRSGYAASKHALHGFFGSLRAELRGTGVGVTLVCPSFVRTAIGESALGGDGGRPRMARSETGTPMDPESVAETIFRAVSRGRRLVLISPIAKLSYLLTRCWPALYERSMLRRLG